MVDRFTEQARRVMELARQEADRLGHRYLGPEHLMLGMQARALGATPWEAGS